MEELETSNEELQATNEELLSSNEELQSTNEELQSVNEELHTVNAEHQGKILELTELNNDLDNLIALTHVAILFLDENLEIRRFTKKVSEIFNIIPSDIGRPFQYIHNDLKNVEIFQLVSDVKNTSIKYEGEVKTNGGNWYIMYILPYQIAQNQFSGVLLNFIDITATKKANDALKNNIERYALAQAKTKFAHWDLNIETNEIIWSDNIETLFGFNHGHIKRNYEAFLELVHPDDRNFVIKAKEDSIRLREMYDIKHRIICPNGEIRWMSEKGEALFNESNQAYRMIGIVQDITHQVEQESNSFIMNKILEQSHSLIIITDSKGNIEYINPRFEEIYGFSIKDLKGKNPRILKSGKTSREIYKELWISISKGEEWNGEFVNRRKDGTFFRVKASISPIKGNNQNITHFLSIQDFFTEYEDV